MPTENWSLFDLLIGKLAIAGSHLASVAHPLALFATAIPAPGTIEAGKLATINRSGEANMTNVRKVDDCERARELAQQIPPSAVLYELAVGLRDRGWKYVQIISNLPSLTHRAMGARPDFHWPCLKSVTELGGGRMLCVTCGHHEGLTVAAEAARVIGMAYYLNVEPVFHDINGVHCMHLVISPALNPEA
jgi:hypothetical protein